MSVRPILRDLTHLGVAAETPPSDAKYIILTNSVGLVGVLVSALYLLVNLSLASPMGGPVASAVVYGLPLWLNRRRCYWAATTWMCLGSMGIQLAFVWVFGYASGNHLYFLPLLGAIALIYPPRHYHCVTDESGGFRLDGVPVGTYTLEVWHEKLGSRETKVRVEEGTTVSVDVEYTWTEN